MGGVLAGQVLPDSVNNILHVSIKNFHEISDTRAPQLMRERSLSRRLLVGAAACCVTQPPQPLHALVEDARLLSFAQSVRAGGDAGLSVWGEPWSNTCTWGTTPQLAPTEADLPGWLAGKLQELRTRDNRSSHARAWRSERLTPIAPSAGRWRATSSLEKVSFPLGRKLLSEAVPGVRMASVLALPNIGATPAFDLEFVAEGRGVRPDRGMNAAAVFEAFWPQARVLEATSPAGGQVCERGGASH